MAKRRARRTMAASRLTSVRRPLLLGSADRFSPGVVGRWYPPRFNSLLMIWREERAGLGEPMDIGYSPGEVGLHGAHSAQGTLIGHGVLEWVLGPVKGLVGRRGLAYSEISRGSPDFRREGPLPIKAANTLAPAKPVKVVCMQCDKIEAECKCDRYCCICQSQECIRLCLDGLFYCADCGTACDLPPVENKIE